jgi:DNA-directed RNA polymerase I subunit RPA2
MCRFGENDTPADFFGEQLRRAGYNYHGNEPMYSGITGEEFPADIYIGLVYYQRLRHMVGDKWQVRTVGPIDQVTRQPVKGRKKGGGIRFGEMERDALLAHGTAYLLQDRLMNCSDYSTAWVCRTCGSMISLGYEDVGLGTDIGFGESRLSTKSEANGEYCRVCRAAEEEDIRKLKEKQVNFSLAGPQPDVLRKEGGLDVIAIPFVFKYLVSELAAMGINLSIGTSR